MIISSKLNQNFPNISKKMELELGLKLARVADEFSSADFQFNKDRAGPLFVSTETATMFILTVHLRGYEKRRIKIEINEDGTRIVVSGEKEVQETIMVGWRLHKTEKEIRGFRKAFKIPDGVILDGISAKFDEDESILTISMPKKEKGISGVSVEEVTDHELARGGSERLQIDDDDDDDKKITKQQRDQEETEDTKENEAAGGESPPGPETVSEKEPQETQSKRKEQTEIEEQGEDEGLTQNIEGTKSVPYEAAQGLHEQSVVSSGKAPNDDIKADKEKEDEAAAREEERGRFKICTSIVAGSTLLLSIVAFVIHFIRTKSQPGKRKD